MIAIGRAHLPLSPSTALDYSNQAAERAANHPAVHARALLLAADAYGTGKLANAGAASDSIAENLLNRAVDLAIASQDTVAMALAKGDRAYFLVKGGRLDESIRSYKEAIPLFEAAGLYPRKAQAFSSIGVAYYQSGQFNKAAESFIASVECRQQHNLPVSAGLLINISMISKETQDWETVIDYTNQALALAQADSNESLVRMCYQNLGATYTNQQDYDQAIVYLNKANEINVRRNDSMHISRYHTGMADVRMGQKDYEAAIISYLQAKRFLPANGDARQRMFAHLNLARVYHKLADGANANYAALALDNALVAHQMATELGLTKNKSEAALVVFGAYQAVGQPAKAVPFAAEYIAIRDSILSAERMKALADLKEQHEAEMRETEIAYLNEQNDMQAENLAQSEQLQANQRLIIWLLGIGVVITALLLALIYRSYQQKNRINTKLAAQNATIEQQNADKETLLKEIHHRVKNNLQVISSLLDLQSSRIDDAAAQLALEDGQSRVKAMALIHQKLYQTQDLAHISFAEYAQQLAKHLAAVYAQTSEAAVTVEGNAELDIDTAIPIGLILNELVSNAFKYAFAASSKGKLRISLARGVDETFVLIVHDNGPGLPADFDFAKSRSLGLRLVRRLSRQLYGSAEYSFDNGSKFTVAFKDTEQRKEVQ